jgi:hypothetical protein
MPTPQDRLDKPATPPRDWELTIGANWINKAGIFILVIGMALALGYSYAHMSPAGRVGVSLAVSAAMLAAGAWLEPRDPYRTFARGLLGGGWAALYFTVYAMQAIDAARVIYNPWLGAILLFAVAAGMIVHSLHYRSQTVTGLAYVIAFVTLGITDVTPFSLVALVPLAASLLYIARRFQWSRLTLFSLIATWATCALRGDTGAPLWETQAIFTVYWLLFECGADGPPAQLLNALGFLSLSLLKWHSAAPDRIWEFLVVTAALYLVSALLRARRGQEWRPAITLTAALAAAAMLLKLEQLQLLLALSVEAELFFLAGLMFNATHLRRLAATLFGLQIYSLATVAAGGPEPPTYWVAAASVDAAFFYANRILRPAEAFYGYAGAGMLALVAAHYAPDRYLGTAWLAVAIVPFAIGWWRHLPDFRLQAYALAGLGLGGTLIILPFPWLALAVAAAVSFAAALCAVLSPADRLAAEERDVLQFTGSLVAVAALATLLWREVPGEYLGLAWMALALPLLELGLRRMPAEFRWQAYAVAVTGALRVTAFNLLDLRNEGPLAPRLIPACAALICYAMAARDTRVRTAASLCGTVFFIAGLWAILPPLAVAPAWAVLSVALLLARARPLSYSLALAAFVRCWCVNLDSPAPVVWASAVIACFYAAQFLEPVGSRSRAYFSLLASTLLAMLLYFQVSGSLLTVAWGIQGMALLAAGFPLRDRLLRLSGMAMLAACMLKLFGWDLRHLETLPRIISFLVLGLILVGVSWIYTRFRDRVSRFL